MRKIVILAILLGIFGNALLLLGVIGLFYPVIILLFTLLFWSVSCILLRREIRFSFTFNSSTKLEKLLIALLVVEFGITLIGVLGPEIGFDALWYHLTLPKLYLQTHTIQFIPGGLFYYSTMPKLTELLYSVPLAFHNEVGAKIIHYLFGIGICAVLYVFSRNYLSKSYALLTVLLFYSNLVVGWESITAYIDLSRTFFELLAFVLLIRWFERGKRFDLYLSAILLGIAVSTKLLVLSSLPIYLLLIGFIYYQKKHTILSMVRNLLIYTGLVLSIPFPWFVLSFLSTGKPFYPFFTDVSQGNFNPLSVTQFLTDTFTIFTRSADPISPLYLIFFPFIFLSLKKQNKLAILISLYSISSLVMWYFLPRIGGGRFILPYLPVYSFLVVYAVSLSNNLKKYSIYQQLLVLLTVLYAVIFIVYRGAANAKFVSYLIGRESKAEFLEKHLTFSYGDFYDIDMFLHNKITTSDRALLYGFHNLYYINFPFVDSSYVQKGDKFNYILTQHTSLPNRFARWNLLYTNPRTGVSMYGNGGMMWEY